MHHLRYSTQKPFKTITMKTTALIISLLLVPVLTFSQSYIHIEDVGEIFTFDQNTAEQARIMLNEDVRVVALTYDTKFRLFRDKYIVEDDYEIHTIIFRNGFRNGVWDYKKAILKGYDKAEDYRTVYNLTLK